MKKGEFDGKVVLITGAASGLGRAASVRFAREGARVCLADINSAGLDETARIIANAGGGARNMPAIWANRPVARTQCALLSGRSVGLMCCAMLQEYCAFMRLLM